VSRRNGQRWSCRFEREGDGRIRAVQVERVDRDGVVRRLRVDGHRLVPVTEPLVELLQRSGVQPRRLAGDRPFELGDPPGPQVELLLAAVRPLTRHDRIAAVAAGVVAMSDEEAVYWHARAHHPGGLPALRLLLTGGK